MNFTKDQINSAKREALREEQMRQALKEEQWRLLSPSVDGQGRPWVYPICKESLKAKFSQFEDNDGNTLEDAALSYCYHTGASLEDAKDLLCDFVNAAVGNRRLLTEGFVIERTLAKYPNSTRPFDD